MKTGYITTFGWLILLCSTTLFSSCKIDDDRKVSMQYLLTVKAIDPDTEQVQDNIFLYVFDQDQKLSQIIKCKPDKEFTLETPIKKDYTFIAIGYSVDMAIPSVALGTSLDDALITLPTTTFAEINVTPSSGDLFYGRLDVTGDCRNTKDIIWIRRKVAALTIITSNLQSGLNTTDEDFNYIAGKTYGTLGFDGVYEGAKIAYHPLSHFSATTKDFIASRFYTYPTQPNEGFCIAIYKGTTLLKTYCTDSDDESLLLKEGKHTVVWIDFDNFGNAGYMDITCQIKDWDDDDINEGFD